MKRFVISLFMVIVITSVAFSASFGAFCGIAEGVNFTPTFTVPFDSLSLDLIFAYGVSESFDLNFSLSHVSVNFSPFDFFWNGLWVMPRYDLGNVSFLKYNVLALNLGYDGNDVSLGVQYHTEIGVVDEVFSIEVNGNLGVLPGITYGGIVAPVLYLNNIVGVPLALYVEGDFSFSIVDGYTYDIIPGVYWSIFKNISLSIGYGVNSASVVSWVYFSF